MILCVFALMAQSFFGGTFMFDPENGSLVPKEDKGRARLSETRRASSRSTEAAARWGPETSLCAPRSPECSEGLRPLQRFLSLRFLGLTSTPSCGASSPSSRSSQAGVSFNKAAHVRLERRELEHGDVRRDACHGLAGGPWTHMAAAFRRSEICSKDGTLVLPPRMALSSSTFCCERG